MRVWISQSIVDTVRWKSWTIEAGWSSGTLGDDGSVLFEDVNSGMLSILRSTTRKRDCWELLRALDLDFARSCSVESAAFRFAAIQESSQKDSSMAASLH